MNESTPGAAARTLRTMVFALVTSPLIILAMLFFVLPFSLDDSPPVAIVLGLIALVGVCFVMAEQIGFRAEPLPPSVEDQTQPSVLKFQALTMIRFVITEFPVIVGLVLSFILDYGIWPLLITTVFAVPAMLFQTYPSRRNVTKVADKLEAGGTRSGLREAFGTN